MEQSARSEITLLLGAWRRGDETVLQRLAEVLYPELHSLARSYLRRERGPVTLQPTELVHEAWLRLTGAAMPDWDSRAHFYAIAARVMRQVLVDQARRRVARKRGAPVVPLDVATAAPLPAGPALLLLDEALGRLERLSPLQHEVVNLHYFGGLTLLEIAGLVGQSESTVGRALRAGKAWLTSTFGETP